MTQGDRAEATLNSIGDAVLSTDADGLVTYLNVVAERMTGWPREAAAGRPLDDVFHIIDGETRALARNPLNLAMRLNKAVGLTPNCVLVRRDGSETEIEDSAAPIYNTDGSIAGAVIVFRDVGVALEVSRQMSHLALHDSLTGLPNRVLLIDRLTSAIVLARRRGRPLAVLFLDIDGFKAVNDSLGHAAGDILLRAVAAALGASLRQSDTVSRYSGDEFVVVLAEIEGGADAAVVAKKLLRAVAGPHRIGTREVTVTASIGMALYPGHGLDAQTLVENADTAMYGAKREGQGHDRLFDSGEPLDGWETDGGALKPPAETTATNGQAAGL
jgi:diguanylate cyclase (GGDEF)-like protein/PAS domain S-box-containing protein